MALTEHMNLARQRVLQGETLSIEEQRALIQALREERGVAPPDVTKPKKASTKKTVISDEDLDAQLSGLGL